MLDLEKFVARTAQARDTGATSEYWIAPFPVGRDSVGAYGEAVVVKHNIYEAQNASRSGAETHDKDEKRTPTDQDQAAPQAKHDSGDSYDRKSKQLDRTPVVQGAAGAVSHLDRDSAKPHSKVTGVKHADASATEGVGKIRAFKFWHKVHLARADWDMLVKNYNITGSPSRLGSVKWYELGGQGLMACIPQDHVLGGAGERSRESARLAYF